MKLVIFETMSTRLDPDSERKGQSKDPDQTLCLVYAGMSVTGKVGGFVGFGISVGFGGRVVRILTSLVFGRGQEVGGRVA